MRTTRAAALTAGLVSVAFAASPATKPVFGPWGVTLADMDTSVGPGSDFFRYTNGGWLKTAVIPPDRQFAGVNLELDKENEARLKSIVAGLAAKPEAALSAEERKLRDLYNAFENTRAIDAAGLDPVKPDLERIAAFKSYADVAAFMGSPASQVSGPFDINIDIDEKNPDAYVILLSQSGLGMPDRDYYLLKDKDSAATREAYRRYLAAMLAFAGVHDAARSAAVYALEERIARVHWPAAERREADKVYNPLSLAALAKFAPQFPWDSYLAAAGVSRRSPRGERVVVV
ncbi:MAG: M13 family metallopeptidase N-terminal domain-containing protein, partial [Steroidobacteraceae bacterium]